MQSCAKNASIILIRGKVKIECPLLLLKIHGFRSAGANLHGRCRPFLATRFDTGVHVQIEPPSPFRQPLVRCKSSRTRRTSPRTELNLHEIPVGVPCYRSNVAPVDVSDFQPVGISMRRESRFADACHVVSAASHSCGSALKGRHVMPFSQSLCEGSRLKRPPT